MELSEPGTCKMAAVQFQATVAFSDVAAYFSEKQWTCLEEWQKEVYKRAMENIHLVILQLGHTIANPDVLVKLKVDNEVCVKDPQNPGIERLDSCSTTGSPTTVAPDILLCINTDEVSNEWKEENPNKAAVQGVSVLESLKVTKDEVPQMCYDHDYGPGTELQNAYRQTVNASKSSSTDSEIILWNNENLGTATEIEVIIPCSLTEKPSHVLLWSKDSGGPKKQNGVTTKVKREQGGLLKRLPGVLKRKRKTPKIESEASITLRETTNVEVTSDLHATSADFGVVYSMFNMDQAHKGQMKHVVTAEELGRRFAEPERFSLRFAQRYLRQRKDGVSNLGEKCRQHNLQPSKNVELTSAWTLITEGDVKYLLESTQTLAAEYWPSRELAGHLSDIFPVSSSRALQLEHTRDYLENLQSSLSEKLLLFDLVTHGGATQLANIIIDCIKSTIEVEMAMQEAD